MSETFDDALSPLENAQELIKIFHLGYHTRRKIGVWGLHAILIGHALVTICGAIERYPTYQPLKEFIFVEGFTLLFPLAILWPLSWCIEGEKYKLYTILILLLGIILCTSTARQFSPHFINIFYFLAGFYLILFSAVNLWKRHAISNTFWDIEDDFNQYLRNIDTAESSALLRSLASAGQPDALLTLGVMIYSGEKYAENKDLGAKYIKLAIAEGAKEPGLSVIEGLGIEVDNLEKRAKVNSPEEVGINLASQCRAKINELFEAGRFTEDQRVDLLEIVRSVEPLHLVNILAILNKDTELDKLAKNAARIKGWDAENLVFYVEE